ncbi:MAG: class A beta-lactamase-related serine hydrolase [Verrucomicrobia bacterium]|nr:class A beta-lactamase-related serine hydrolase [Verrucomicrobiota bacterium]
MHAKRHRFICLSFLLLFVLASCTTAVTKGRPQIDSRLQLQIKQLVRGFQGEVGIYVRNVKTGQTAAWQADVVFPTASMVKVPILCGLFDKIDKGELKYNQELNYHESLKYDDGVSGSLRDGTRLPLCEVVLLMITLSDNTASLWLQQLAGGGAAINDWLAQHHFEKTRVNSRTPGRESEQQEYGWGQTTPREMADLMAVIAAERAVSPDASEQMFRVLSRPYWDGEALSQIPPYIHAASKSGAVNASKSEVVFVSGPSGDYVFCVITKNQKDQRWTNDNEGCVLIRRLSRLLWTYFEPRSSWQPGSGGEKWAK